MFITSGSRTKPRFNPDLFITPQGRLTLQTGTPVMTSTQSGKTTIFYTPYLGNSVPIFNGSIFVPIVVPEISVSTTDTIYNPSAIGASKVNDWYIWQSPSGPRLSHGVDWTSDTARNTTNIMVNGILVNASNIANGPLAKQGTYVGTTRSNGSSQLDWIIGGSASGGTAGFLGIWNIYNRVSIQAAVTDNGASYTYTSATVRQARASAGNQISFVNGLAEDGIIALYMSRVSVLNVVNASITFGIGLDATTSYLYQYAVISNGTVGANLVDGAAAPANIAPQLGFHVISANEGSDGTNASTFDGGSLNVLSAILRM